MSALAECTVTDSPSRPQSQPLRITHVVSSLKVGGMEQFVLRIAQAQIAAGHRVSVVALQGGPLDKRAASLDVPVHILGGSNPFLRMAKGALLMRSLKPEVVNAHNPTSLHYAILGKRLAGARLVMTDHNASKTARQATPNELRALDQVIPVSSHTGSNLRQPELQGKITVIHNGVELPTLRRSRAEVRAEFGLAGDERLLAIMVGRLHPGKGHLCLLDALSRVRAAGVPLTVLLAGDGQERAAIEARGRELDLGPDRHQILGFRDHVPDLVAASDLFLFPSEDEGLPLSVLEAMAVGCPVIATPVGGIPEVVSHGEDGILTPVNDAERLAAAILDLSGDPDRRRRMGEHARRAAAEDLSFSEMVRKYEALYRRLLATSN